LGRYHVGKIRKHKTLKRSPGEGKLVAFEEYHGPTTDASPDRAFEVAWAREVIAEATRRTQAECERAGRHDVWNLLKGRVLDPALQGVPPLSYNELVEQFGL